LSAIIFDCDKTSLSAEENAMYERKTNKRERAINVAFEDVLGDLRRAEPADSKASTVGEDTMDGAHFAALLDKHFDKLDPNRDGITKEELTQALLTPWQYKDDEYAMLKLLGKYFDTIIHMSDDQEGPETVITELDKDVVVQFLRHSNFTLAQLQQWRAMDQSPDV
jgi:hypothetical protein